MQLSDLLAQVSITFACSYCPIMKKLMMKKPSACIQMQNVMKKTGGPKKVMKKKPYACIKTHNVMKKTGGLKIRVQKLTVMRKVQKLTEEQKASKVKSRAMCRKLTSKEALTPAQRKQQYNVCARAKKAARLGRPMSHIQCKKLQEVATAAHSSELIAMAAHDMAEGAQRVSAEAKSESADAKAIANATRCRFTGLSRSSKTMAQQITSLENRVEQGQGALMKTQAVATHNAERLDAYDAARRATDEFVRELGQNAA
jgi:hypothetical protein